MPNNNEAKIVLSAEDKTKAAFEAAKRNLEEMRGAGETSRAR